MNELLRQLLLKPILPLGFCGLVAKSCLTLKTLWTVARQAPLSMGFSRQEYWSGFPFHFSGYSKHLFKPKYFKCLFCIPFLVYCITSPFFQNHASQLCCFLPQSSSESSVIVLYLGYWHLTDVSSLLKSCHRPGWLQYPPMLCPASLHQGLWIPILMTFTSISPSTNFWSHIILFAV